jgi:hypothetical protein
MSINLAAVIEKTEHALLLLDEVSDLIPGRVGMIVKASVKATRIAFDAAGVRKALEEVQAQYSAQAQNIANEWPEETTKS